MSFLVVCALGFASHGSHVATVEVAHRAYHIWKDVICADSHQQAYISFSNYSSFIPPHHFVWMAPSCGADNFGIRLYTNFPTDSRSPLLSTFSGRIYTLYSLSWFFLPFSLWLSTLRHSSHIPTKLVFGIVLKRQIVGCVLRGDPCLFPSIFLEDGEIVPGFPFIHGYGGIVRRGFCGTRRIAGAEFVTLFLPPTKQSEAAPFPHENVGRTRGAHHRHGSQHSFELILCCARSVVRRLLGAADAKVTAASSACLFRRDMTYGEGLNEFRFHWACLPLTLLMS